MHRILFLAALLAGAATDVGAATNVATPPDGGWLVAGPFEQGALAGFEDSLDKDYLVSSGLSAGGEAATAPLRVSAPGARTWREAGTGEGVDFIALLGPGADCVAYAYHDVFSSSARRAAMKIGSDDGVKVWVNGELVLARHVRRALSAEEDATPVSLAKGRNRVLVKVTQGQGAWGFALRLVPLEDDARAGASGKLAALAAYPDDLIVPQGGAIRGVAMTKPAFCVEGAATIELVGSGGEILASAPAPAAGRFSIKAPPGFSGPARLRAKGRGPLAGLASPETAILLGDGAAMARSAAAKARAAASSGTDAAPTLEFLAKALEGSLPPSFGGFDMSVLALAEVADMTASPARRPAGLARYAYRSVLDGSLQPFSLCLPPRYDPARRYGLVVALHGAGGNDYEMAASLSSARSGDLLIVAPYGRGDLCYTGQGERDVLDVVDLVLARYAIDLDRVYVTGRSMGGYGAWRLGRLYPKRFAAVASFAGWTDAQCLENLSSTPVLAVHGDADGTVPIDSDEAAVRRLESLGADARLEVLPGIGHDAMGAWTEKGGPARILDWLKARRRVAWPAVVKVRTTMARSGEGAWASILGLARPLSIAALDARIVDSRHVTVDTQNVSAFELDLRHPGLAKGGRILILADGFNLTADSGSASARFELGPGGRFAAVRSAGPGATPRNGGSGYAALFDGPLRIVYGTKAKGRAADNLAAARALAEWPSGSYEVIPDTAASPAMEASCSILLVGGPEENEVASRLAGRLGAQAKTGEGLILCCPNPEAPGRLLGLLAFPSQLRGKAAADFARALVAPLQGYGPGTEPCGYGAPDAIAFDKAGKPLWFGFFDWRWGKLSRTDAGGK